VLAVEVDPQFAMSRRLGVQVSGLASTIVDVLAGWTGAREALVTGVHGIDVLPGRGSSPAWSWRWLAR